MNDKLRVWERASDMVLAEHLTRSGRTTTDTLETVRFERPSRVSFRLVRGPVPHVAETYELEAEGERTTVVYTGELGTDLWALGACGPIRSPQSGSTPSPPRSTKSQPRQSAVPQPADAIHHRPNTPACPGSVPG